MYSLLIPEVDLLHKKIRRRGFLREPRDKRDVVRYSSFFLGICKYLVANILCPRRGSSGLKRTKMLYSLVYSLLITTSDPIHLTLYPLYM